MIFLSIYAYIYAHIDLPVIGYMLYWFFVFLIFTTLASANKTVVRYTPYTSVLSFSSVQYSFLSFFYENSDKL